MSVVLLRSAGYDVDVVNGARVSFNRASIDLTEADEGLIRRLMRDGHTSPFTHVWAKFRVSCSIGAARQIARHGHYIEINEYSTRYSEVPDEFIPPPLQKQVGKAMEYRYEALDAATFDRAMQIVQDAYDASYKAYRALRALDVAREDARQVLPLGTRTHLILSSHLKGWLRFLAQRTEGHAQLEVRGIANTIETHLGTFVPVTMAAWHEAGRRPL